MLKTIVFALSALATLAVLAEPKINYVGLGRYACSGTARECAPTQQNNDRLELQREQTRKLELQRRELQTQTELMRSQRRGQ